MRFKGKVANFSNGRKIIEIPKAIRDFYSLGEVVEVVTQQHGIDKK